MTTKQSLEACLSEYTSQELIDFHANLNALFLCCSEDFKLFPLLMQVHFFIAQRVTVKKDRLCKIYLQRLSKLFPQPEGYEIKHLAH